MLFFFSFCSPSLKLDLRDFYFLFTYDSGVKGLILLALKGWVLSLLLLLYFHIACTLASVTTQNRLERVFSWVPDLVCPTSVNSLFCYAPEGSDSTKHTITAIKTNAPQTKAVCKPAMVYLNHWEFCHCFKENQLPGYRLCTGALPTHALASAHLQHWHEAHCIDS